MDRWFDGTCWRHMKRHIIINHDYLNPFIQSIEKMKSEDLRKVAMRLTDDGMSSIQIEKQL